MMPTEDELDERVVALVRLPMSIKPLAKVIKSLVRAHGEDLHMQDQHGWLVFRTPEDE